MIKLNFCKKVSRKYFCVANGLAFLTVITMCSCEDNVSDNITGDIDAIEESVIYETGEFGITRKESVEEVMARADAQFQKAMNLRKNRVAAASGIPHYVGVLSGSGGCPSGVPNIGYHQDCENTKNNTHYEKPDCTGCYKSKGAVVRGGDVDWSICIVDAKKYNFQKTKYAYAIFDFNMEQYLGEKNIKSVFVLNDDEDKNNRNDFGNSSYGFDRVESGYPKKVRRGNTEFWLLYFDADADSEYKLPKLGFEYDVFSNFNCDYASQAVLVVDSEDKNNINNVKIYYPATATEAAKYIVKNGDWIDPKFNIIKNAKGHMFYAIQKSSAYRN